MAERTNIGCIQLDGKVFVVTGGARGLGLTLAEALVEGGGHGMVDILVTYIDADESQYTVLTG